MSNVWQTYFFFQIPNTVLIWLASVGCLCPHSTKSMHENTDPRMNTSGLYKSNAQARSLASHNYFLR